MKDRLYLVGTAIAIWAILFAAILFPVFRSIVFWLLIVATCWLLLLVIIGIVLFVRFSRAIKGPRPLSGTRCPSCRKRRAMQETSRAFLHGNVKVNLDHYRVVYRCTTCGHEQEQKELVDAIDESDIRSHFRCPYIGCLAFHCSKGLETP